MWIISRNPIRCLLWVNTPFLTLHRMRPAIATVANSPSMYRVSVFLLFLFAWRQSRRSRVVNRAVHRLWNYSWTSGNKVTLKLCVCVCLENPKRRRKLRRKEMRVAENDAEKQRQKDFFTTASHGDCWLWTIQSVLYAAAVFMLFTI